MSRSRKKNPFVSNTCKGYRSGVMQQWKAQSSREVRRIPVNEEIGNNAYIKRITTQWDAPNDGKHRFDEEKAYRK